MDPNPKLNLKCRHTLILYMYSLTTLRAYVVFISCK
jgi:hypothetical protein